MRAVREPPVVGNTGGFDRVPIVLVGGVGEVRSCWRGPIGPCGLCYGRCGGCGLVLTVSKRKCGRIQPLGGFRVEKSNFSDPHAIPNLL